MATQVANGKRAQVIRLDGGGHHVFGRALSLCFALAGLGIVHLLTIGHVPNEPAARPALPVVAIAQAQ